MNCDYHKECDDYEEAPCIKWKRTIRRDLDALAELQIIVAELRRENEYLSSMCQVESQLHDERLKGIIEYE